MRNFLPVARDDDRLAGFDARQQARQMGLGFEGSNFPYGDSN